MKTPKFPSVSAKKPNYAPMDLKKLGDNDTRKNERFTGSAAVAKAATPHRNTILSTDNRTATDNSLDSDTGADFDTSIGHVNHADDDSDLDGLDLASSTGDYRRNGHHLNRATGADFDDTTQGCNQGSAAGGNSRTVKNAVDTASPDATQSSRNGEGADDMPPWKQGCFDAAQIKHVADCLCIDTVGLEFSDIPEEIAKLAKKFSARDEDGQAISGTGWSKSAFEAANGKHSFAVKHVDATEKLTIEGSNAMHRQGHNVVSSGDMVMTAYSMVQAMNAKHKWGWPKSWGYQIAHGNHVDVTRIDAVLLLRVPDGVSKADFINALAVAGIKAGLDISLYSNESVYFDQSSQLEAAKLYDKEAELRRARKGGLPVLPGIEELLELNKRTVRLECVFRAKRLVQIAKAYGGRPLPCLFTKELLAEMVLTLLQKLALHGNIFRRLEHAELLAIDLPFRSTVAHWQNGEVLQDMVKSERVLKEHKAYLKKEFHLNLNRPYPGLVREPMSLAEILVPANFIPVPEVVRNNPELFYQLDMEAERRKLRPNARSSGISWVLVNPYGPKD